MKVFISYATVDKAIGDRVFRVLDGFKLDAWFDRSFGDGDERLNVVKNEIAARDHFFFVASREAIECGGVFEEELALMQKRISADPTCRFTPVIVDMPILPAWMQQHQSVFVNNDLERAIIDIVFSRQSATEHKSSEVLFNPAYKKETRMSDLSVVEYDLPAFFLAAEPEFSEDVNRVLEGEIIKSALESACTNRQESSDRDWVRRSVFRIERMFASENVVSLLMRVSHDITQAYGVNLHRTINFDLRRGNLYNLGDVLDLPRYRDDFAMALGMEVRPADDATVVDHQGLYQELSAKQFLVNERGLRVLDDSWDLRFIDFTNADLAGYFKYDWSGFARHIAAIK